MPVIIDQRIPAFDVLKNEGLQLAALHENSISDPLRIAILNLMPTKEITEIQLCRLLAKTGFNIKIEWLKTATYQSKNADQFHMEAFYTTFDKIKDQQYDGLIITGAPVEMMEFKDVIYWNELKGIMDWADTNVKSTMFICWAAQAGLFYHFGVDKYELDKKASGVFLHKISNDDDLFNGMPSEFNVPHSRYTDVSGYNAVPDLKVLSESERVGLYLAASEDKSKLFIPGHPEYDYNTLQLEYERDIKRGIAPEEPENYFSYRDNRRTVEWVWKEHAEMLYLNWIRYYILKQETAK